MKRTTVVSLLLISPLVLMLGSTGCSKKLGIVKKDTPPASADAGTQPGSADRFAGAGPGTSPETVVVEDLPALQEADLPQESDGTSTKVDLGLGDVFFDFDAFVITLDGTVVLKKNAELLLAHRGTRVRIEGTTDERGTNVYNLALGERRALAAKRYLVDLGVTEDQIMTVSYGEEKQYCAEHSEECWAQNRRDHFATLESPQVGKME